MKLTTAATGLIMLAVASCYWLGLNGPLILDDAENLNNLHRYLDGNLDWHGVVFGNRSGALGRPVAMASFLLDAYVAGFDVWQFKFTNLLIHLICGGLAIQLYRQVIQQDPALRSYAIWLPLLLGFLWLAMPIQTSTVLYVVQRMAQLSALFTLAALVAFMHGRLQLNLGKRAPGIFLLFVVVPALTALATYSKENGVLVPAFALLLEASYFRGSFSQSRRAVAAFFLLFLILPGLAALAYLSLHPALFAGGYAGRAFTLGERLLTENRILWDYVASIFFPYGPRMGLFHDNFVISRDIFSPATTIVSIAAWIAVLAVGFRLRRRSPSILAGSLIFLVGHAMESTVIPLELYFEHRNYLPSIGALLTVAGMVALAYQKIPAPTPTFKRAIAASLVALAGVYAFATTARAIVWSSTENLYTQAAQSNPTSPRLRSDLALFNMQAGNLEGALDNIAIAEKYDSRSELMTASLWRVLGYCYTGTPPPPPIYEEIQDRASNDVTLFGMTAWEMVATHAERGECPGLDVGRLARLGELWIGKSPLPGTSHPIWRTRYYIARLLAENSEFADAKRLADRAWRDSDKNTGIGVFLFQISATLGDEASCIEVLDALKRAQGGSDIQLNKAIAVFDAAIRNHEISAAKG